MREGPAAQQPSLSCFSARLWLRLAAAGDRNPLWPLQESPGWKPDALRSAGVAPKAPCCGPSSAAAHPPGPGTQHRRRPPARRRRRSSWRGPGPWVGLPLPVISPALAVLAAPPSRIAVANTVAAAVRNRMFPPEDDADGAVTVLETGLLKY